ncbi:MAG: glycerol-3-phosphate dehydrogenase C-terminal domain-containing protein [Paracoccaceae bacterium]
MGDVDRLVTDLQNQFSYLDQKWARRLIRSYGTLAPEILGNSVDINALCQDFSATLYENEVDWLIENERARSSDDIPWHRSKLGLHLNEAQVKVLDEYVRTAIQAMLPLP